MIKTTNIVWILNLILKHIKSNFIGNKSHNEIYDFLYLVHTPVGTYLLLEWNKVKHQFCSHFSYLQMSALRNLILKNKFMGKEFVKEIRLNSLNYV